MADNDLDIDPATKGKALVVEFSIEKVIEMRSSARRTRSMNSTSGRTLHGMREARKLEEDDFERVALWAAVGVGPTSWSHIAPGASAELVDDSDDTVRGSALKPDADERGRVGVGLEFKVAENTRVRRAGEHY